MTHSNHPRLTPILTHNPQELRTHSDRFVKTPVGTARVVQVGSYAITLLPMERGRGVLRIVCGVN